MNNKIYKKKKQGKNEYYNLKSRLLSTVSFFIVIVIIICCVIVRIFLIFNIFLKFKITPKYKINRLIYFHLQLIAVGGKTANAKRQTPQPQRAKPLSPFSFLQKSNSK